MTTHGQQIEHTPEQMNTARQQISVLQQITGIQLTAAERSSVVDDATRRMFISGPSRAVILARVVHEFADALRARGDEKSVAMAERIERARQEKISATPAPRPAEHAPATRTIDAHAEESLRSLARSYGVDPDYLVREVRTAQIRVSRDSSNNTSVAVTSSYVDPNARDQHDRSVANNLAASILFSAYGSGRPYAGGTPNFSDDNLVSGAARYSFVDAPATINDRTTNRWLTAQATRLQVDRTALEKALTTYATLRQGDPALAERYLTQNDLPPRAMELVRVAAARFSSETIGDAPPRFYLSLADTLAIRNEVARDERLRRAV